MPRGPVSILWWLVMAWERGDKLSHPHNYLQLYLHEIWGQYWPSNNREVLLSCNAIALPLPSRPEDSRAVWRQNWTKKINKKNTKQFCFVLLECIKMTRSDSKDISFVTKIFLFKINAKLNQKSYFKFQNIIDFSVFLVSIRSFIDNIIFII